MLTQADIEEIKIIIKEEVGNKINLLPTKDEYFERMDSLAGQMKTIQETLDLHSGQHEEIHDIQQKTEKRLNKVEDVLKIPHPSP
jgi:uncharacterized protein Veg